MRKLNVFAIALLLASAVQTVSAQSAMKVSLNGSTAYAAPTDVPLKTALLLGTSRFDHIVGQSRRGVLNVGEVIVLLSNQEIACDSVYGHSRKPSDDASIFLMAGTFLLFAPESDWTSTPLGKTLADSAQADAEHTIDRFALSLRNDKKSIYKEEVKANAGSMTLTRKAKQWNARITLNDSKGSVDANVPLQFCPMPKRDANVLNARRPKNEPEIGPLLGMGALLTATLR